MGGGGETTETDCQWVVEITRKLQSLKRDQVNFIMTQPKSSAYHIQCALLYIKNLKKSKQNRKLLQAYRYKYIVLLVRMNFKSKVWPFA